MTTYAEYRIAVARLVRLMHTTDPAEEAELDTLAEAVDAYEAAQGWHGPWPHPDNEAAGHDAEADRPMGMDNTTLAQAIRRLVADIDD